MACGDAVCHHGWLDWPCAWTLPNSFSLSVSPHTSADLFSLAYIFMATDGQRRLMDWVAYVSKSGLCYDMHHASSTKSGVLMLRQECLNAQLTWLSSDTSTFYMIHGQLGYAPPAPSRSRLRTCTFCRDTRMNALEQLQWWHLCAMQAFLVSDKIISLQS